MEIIEGLGAAFIVFLVISAIAQVVFSYALQVISEKNELPEFASFLSWIPMLNIYPVIRCGDGNFTKFMLGIVGFVVLSGGAGAVSAMAGGMVAVAAGLVVALLVIGAMVYMATIMMATAESRGLSKWIGLLTFVPIANFFVYPYIAFHDGFAAPNKVGLVIGLLLAFGPIPGQVAMIDTFKESYAEFEQRAEAGQMAAANGEGISLDSAMNSALGEMGTAMEITTQLAMLDGMDPSNPHHAELMRSEIVTLRAKIAQLGASSGKETVAGLTDAVDAIEMQLAAAGASPIGLGQAVPDTPVGDRTGRAAPLAAMGPPPITAGIGRDGDRGFAVPEAPECPPGSMQNSATPPGGLKRWCEKTGADAGIKHGWLTQWHENGQPALAGEYRDGMRVGVWTRWHEDGTKRVQAEFANGMQDGVMMAWDADGAKVHESSFAGGGPASR